MMMDARPATEDHTMISALYEASIQGSVLTLNQLMEKDPRILTKLSLTTTSETPLHISASLGRVDFTATLLRYKPTLSSGLDSHGRTPLHLASAEGHIEIVQELLRAYADASLVRDQDGRIPLHYAAMRGPAGVVRDLITTKPDSVKELDRGETVFHLCIKYSQLETLKVLVEFVGHNNKILNSIDCNTGNTILHLAVMLKQTENIKYLLSLPGIKEAANTENKIGFTALDILEHSPSDFRSLECRCLLMEAGIKSKKKQNPANHVAVADNEKKCLEHVISWFKQKDVAPNDWLDKTQGNLMVVASVISTTCYQSAIQAPESDRDAFIICNTISFVASLGVTFLLLSGLPLRNKFCVWLLSIIVLLNLITLALSYLFGAPAFIPDGVLYSSLIILMALIALSALFLTVRFYVWVRRTFKHKRSNASQKLEMSLMKTTQATTALESSI